MEHFLFFGHHLKDPNGLHHPLLLFHLWRKSGLYSKERWSDSVFCLHADKCSYLTSLILPNECLRLFNGIFCEDLAEVVEEQLAQESFWIKLVIWSWLEEIWHTCCCLIFDTCGYPGLWSHNSWIISFQQLPGLPSLICMRWGDYHFISEGHFVTLRFCHLHSVLL